MKVAFGTARWEPLQIFKDSLMLIGVHAETCSQFPTPRDCKPSDNWLTVLALWEIRAARKLKFSLQKEKPNTAGKKGLAVQERESWKQQYYRKPIVDHKLHLNKQCAAKVTALCSNPISKHTSCQRGQSPTGCNCTWENDPAPVQDRDGQTGNVLNEAKEKFTDTQGNAHTKSDQWGWWDWFSVQQQILSEGRKEATHGQLCFCCGVQNTTLHVCWLWSLPSAIVPGWSLHKHR